MGKRIIIGAILIILIMLALYFGVDSGPYNEISITELTTMVENENTFVLVIGQENCTYCDSYKETMKKIIDNYDLDIKYINVSQLSEEEVESLNEFLCSSYSGTPTTIFFVDGIEKTTYNRIDGNQSYSIVKDKLISQGYIEE